MSSNTCTWPDLPQLSQPMIDHLTTTLGFPQVTKVQKAVVPLFLGNKDVCVKACTGSGKTLAFVVPLVQSLLNKKMKMPKDEVYALVIAPSRELAVQIYEIMEKF